MPWFWFQGAEVPLQNWSLSNLAAFNNWLGMLKVGFEAKTLALFRKMKVRKEVRGWEGGKRRKNSSSSKFEREMKKLESFMNYKGSESGRSGCGNEQ